MRLNPVTLMILTVAIIATFWSRPNAQEPVYPFSVGESIYLGFGDRVSDGGGNCKVLAIKGHFVQCAQRENRWWNLQAAVLIQKEK